MHSSITRAYFASPPWAQNALLSAYGLWLRHLRYGPQGARALTELRRSQWAQPSQLERLQLGALNALLAHARTAVPFYAERLPAGPLHHLSELDAVPLLRKDEVRRAGDAMHAVPRRAQRLVEIHTGGTTGTPLTIVASRDALRRNYAFFERFREATGVSRGMRTATFAGRTVVPPWQARPPFWRYNAAARTLLLSSYHIAPDTIPAYVEALASFRPELIDSYPSSLEPIARYLHEHAIHAIRPRAIITSSETLLPEARDTIEGAFGCRVYDHYGAAEMAAFITQCEAGHYHVNPEFGIVEVLRDGCPAALGETGELVATGFVNPVMPFIRYVTGDLAVQGHAGERCACGRWQPTIERIIGRMDDVLVTPEGRRIGRLDPIFKSVAQLVETRIVQDARDHVRVEAVARDDLAPDERDTLLRELRHRLGPSMRIDFVRVARIPRTAGGKLRAVVNLLQPAPGAPAYETPDGLASGPVSQPDKAEPADPIAGIGRR